MAEGNTWGPPLNRSSTFKEDDRIMSGCRRQNFVHEDRGTYRYLDAPLQKQCLHLLHEGRLLDSSDYIPHHDEEGRAATKNLDDMRNYLASEWVEQTSLGLGGDKDIDIHPAVQPGLPIEDPSIRPSMNIDPGSTAVGLERDQSIEGFKYKEESEDAADCVMNTISRIVVITILILVAVLLCIKIAGN